MNFLYDLIAPLQSYLFENVILPVMHLFAMTAWADEIYDVIGDIFLGLFSMMIIFLLLRPLEAWIPVERWKDRKAVRVDVIYTLMMRSGLLPLMFFLLFDPLFTTLQTQMHMADIFSVQLEDIMPWLHSQVLLSFIFYVVIFDFFDYIRHRMQHRFEWWWGLHCIHHSQRQLSLWSDERNHIFDSFIKVAWFTLLAVLLGIPGGQFLIIVLMMKLVESLSHTNVGFNFGNIMSRVLVSPVFHRIHHGIGVGHEGKYYGCNFATLFPIWDIIFGTANFSKKIPATGIRDQLTSVNYGNGFIEQQVIGFKRMIRGQA